MKKKMGLLLVYLIVVFSVGCSDNSKVDISELDNEEDAIIQAFGKYNNSKGKGVVLINEKESKDDRTYIYHIAKLPSIENYKNTLKTNEIDEIREQKKQVYKNIETETNKEVAGKIDKLYKNKNVDKIRVEVGVVWPYSKTNYTKPGENVIGKNIAYVKTYNFNRENYEKELKKIKQNHKVSNKID